MRLTLARRIKTALNRILLFSKAKPRESALVLLGSSLLLYFSFYRLSEVVGASRTRSECLSRKQEIIDAYERVDDLVSSAYSLDAYSRVEIDRLRDLKRSVDNVHSAYLRLIPDWEE